MKIEQKEWIVTPNLAPHNTLRNEAGMARVSATLIPVVTFAGGVLAPILAQSVPGFTPDAPPLGYACYQARGDLKIDGKLDDPAWADAPWSEPFRDIEGDKRPD